MFGFIIPDTIFVYWVHSCVHAAGISHSVWFGCRVLADGSCVRQGATAGPQGVYFVLVGLIKVE